MSPLLCLFVCCFLLPLLLILFLLLFFLPHVLFVRRPASVFLFFSAPVFLPA